MYQMSAVQKTWTMLYCSSVTVLTPNQDWTTGLSKTGNDYIMNNKAQPGHFHSHLRKSKLCIYTGQSNGCIFFLIHQSGKAQ